MNQTKTVSKAATRENKKAEIRRAVTILTAMTLSLFAVYCLI